MQIRPLERNFIRQNTIIFKLNGFLVFFFFFNKERDKGAVQLEILKEEKHYFLRKNNNKKTMKYAWHYSVTSHWPETIFENKRHLNSVPPPSLNLFSYIIYISHIFLCLCYNCPQSYTRAHFLYIVTKLIVKKKS